MDKTSMKNVNPESSQAQEQEGPANSYVWYCSSRWLLAHHDSTVNIHTISSHMCLANLLGDDEYLLAIVDFKLQAEVPSDSPDKTSKRKLNSQSIKSQFNSAFDSRLRVYRGQQLIYSHFLSDLPSSMAILASSPAYSSSPEHSRSYLGLTINDDIYFYHKLKPAYLLSLEDNDTVLGSLSKSEVEAWQMVRQNRVDVNTLYDLLAGLANELGHDKLTSHSRNFLAINEQEQRHNYVLMWKFKKLHGIGEHLMSMDTICCSCPRYKHGDPSAPFQAFDPSRHTIIKPPNAQVNPNSVRWQRILEIQRDGLVVATEDRHLIVYELVRPPQGVLAPVSTINKAQRKSPSPTPLQQQQQQQQQPQQQHPWLRFEAHMRLESVAQKILVEHRLPSSFDPKLELRMLSYKLVVACRNRCLYAIEQAYVISLPQELGDDDLVGKRATQLAKFECDIVDIQWCTEDEQSLLSSSSGADNQTSGSHLQNNNNKASADLLVVCSNRRLFRLSSESGACKWAVELDAPAVALVCIPATGTLDMSLVGVAGRANRVDFYASSSGKIVDSIYFANDRCQAIKFGRFGREQNCLCLVTRRGHLMIFIMKRNARFANGQCLSSASVCALSSVLRLAATAEPHLATSGGPAGSPAMKLAKSLAAMPSAFNLDKLQLFCREHEHESEQQFKTTNTPGFSSPRAKADMANHDCNSKSTAKSNTKEELRRQSFDLMVAREMQSQQLQIPMKTRDFVHQIVQQADSTAISRVFGLHMAKLRDKIRSANELEPQLSTGKDGQATQDSRMSLIKLVGLGNIYKANVSFRLNLDSKLKQTHLLEEPKSQDLNSETEQIDGENDSNENDRQVCVMIFAAKRPNTNPSQSLSHNVQIKPFKFEFDLPNCVDKITLSNKNDQTKVTSSKQQKSQVQVFEKTIEFKLIISEQSTLADNSSQQQSGQSRQLDESISLDVFVLLESKKLASRMNKSIQRPIFVSSLEINLDQ